MSPLGLWAIPDSCGHSSPTSWQIRNICWESCFSTRDSELAGQSFGSRLDVLQTELWSTTEWKHTIMEQTIVARLYYPPGECQGERNEPPADTYHMQSNNLTQTVSLSHARTASHTTVITFIYQTRIWRAACCLKLPTVACSGEFGQMTWLSSLLNICHLPGYTSSHTVQLCLALHKSNMMRTTNDGKRWN